MRKIIKEKRTSFCQRFMPGKTSFKNMCMFYHILCCAWACMYICVSTSNHVLLLSVCFTNCVVQQFYMPFFSLRTHMYGNVLPAYQFKALGAYNFNLLFEYCQYSRSTILISYWAKLMFFYSWKFQVSLLKGVSLFPKSAKWISYKRKHVVFTSSLFSCAYVTFCMFIWLAFEACLLVRKYDGQWSLSFHFVGCRNMGLNL